MSKLMVVITGPTGVGKTKTGIALAGHYNSEIISADSRQIYKEIPIGTAAPTIEECAGINYHLIATRSISDYYNAYEFEQEALTLTNKLFEKHKTLFMVGGSMMYIDAFCDGIDELPTIDPELRKDILQQYENKGLSYLRKQLKNLDPIYYDQVDLKNHKRIIHALEICIMTGKPYSELRLGKKKVRPFKILKIGLNIKREELYQRINQRVLEMKDKGLIEEAKALIKNQNLNSLNTVGFKELFPAFRGEYPIEKAIELIQRNSRRYAKKQLSWFRRDKIIHWFHPDDINGIISLIDNINRAV